jgi:L-seryl-tRNA(Ser) seleniumtransferase
MVKALELYLNQDHEALNQHWQERLERVSREITRVPGVSTEFFMPEIANHVPHMRIKLDPARIKLTPQEVSRILRKSKPAIVIAAGDESPGLAMNSFMLKPGEDKIVAEQLVTLFKANAA